MSAHLFSTDIILGGNPQMLIAQKMGKIQDESKKANQINDIQENAL